MYEPELYELANGIQRRDTMEYIEEFEDKLGKISGRCLDIGTGTGDVAVDFILPKLNQKATLMLSDISEPMLNFMKEKYGHIERLEFMKLDIETTDLAENLIAQFDNITSFYCLHWCKTLHQPSENIFKLLRPGGTAILAFVAKCRVLDAYTELATVPKYQPYLTDANHFIPPYQKIEYPLRSFKSLLKDLGFQIHHCSIRKKYHVFQTLEAVRKFHFSINPFLHRIPADLKEEYKKDLIKEVMERHIMFKNNKSNGEEDCTMFTYDTFLVHLKKPLST